MEKIKVLFVLDYINHNSGVSSMVMNYYAHMDHSKFSIDFLLYEAPEENILRYLKKKGSQIYAPGHPVELGYGEYMKKIDGFFLENQGTYEVVHVHIPNAAFVVLKCAKKHGVPVRILHSHNSRGADGMLKKCRNLVLNKWGIHYANHYMACSEAAAKFLYGKHKAGKAEIINNAIDFQKFQFSQTSRECIREELGIGQELVLGHAGRFSKQKNHEFIVEIAKGLKEKGIDFKFLLLGEGELQEQIQEKTALAGLEENILFLGVRKNVKEYMDAMDLFVLPSLYEGLPYVCVEAQINGLTCLISENVTKEVKLSEAVQFLKITDAEEWVHAIMEYLDKQNFRTDNDKEQNLCLNDYDISVQAKNMEDHYFAYIGKERYENTGKV